MSRCFPYPPPGYATQHKADFMIESLKKVKKAKKERKEKKRDKKEKDKTKRNGEVDKKKHKDKRRHKDKRHQDDGSRQELRKRRENELEHLEKSGLTEENGHPVGFQNSCDSSGSTLNHNKRHNRRNSSNDGAENFGHRMKLLLPCQTFKHEQTEQQSSAPGKLIEGGKAAACEPLEETTKLCTNPGTNSQHLLQRSEIHSRVSPHELKLRNLFENWVPTPTCSEIPDYDDQEWLFRPKQNQSRGTKRIRAVADSSSHKCSAPPWSRACHLPEVDLYALPFTVPF